MVNLLSEKAHRFVSRLYYFRVFTIFVFILAFVILVSTAFLIPSYLRATAEADAATSYLVASKKAIDTGHGTASAELTVLTERIAILKTYTHSPEIARTLSAVTRAVPKGVMISRISITVGEKSTGTLSITGKADTRTNLLAFVKALQAEPALAAASVPVSALAGDTNLPYSLSFPFKFSDS